MAFCGTGWAEKQGVFVTRDECAGGQIEDQAAIHFLVESKVEVIESTSANRGTALVWCAAPANAHPAAQVRRRPGSTIAEQARTGGSPGEPSAMLVRKFRTVGAIRVKIVSRFEVPVGLLDDKAVTALA